MDTLNTLTRQVDDLKNSIERRSRYSAELRQQVNRAAPNIRTLTTQLENEKTRQFENIAQISSIRIRLAEDRNILANLQQILANLRSTEAIQVICNLFNILKIITIILIFD